MKKNLFLIIALFVATSMSAQFYLGAKVGYGIGTERTVVGQTTSADGLTISNNYGSLGQGFTPGLKLGYFFNDNLGIELGINYLFGSKITYEDDQTTNSTYTDIRNTSQLRLLPALVYKTEMGLYGRFGLVLPIAGKTVVEETWTSPGMTDVDIREVKGQLARGFTAAMGYAFELNDNMQLFGELEYIALTIRSKTAMLTQSTSNGADNMAGLPTAFKEANFVDEVNTSSNTIANPNFDPNKPYDALRAASNYSSLRINIGITMSF